MHTNICDRASDAIFSRFAEYAGFATKAVGQAVGEGQAVGVEPVRDACSEDEEGACTGGYASIVLCAYDGAGADLASGGTFWFNCHETIFSRRRRDERLNSIEQPHMCTHELYWPTRRMQYGSDLLSSPVPGADHVGVYGVIYQTQQGYVGTVPEVSSSPTLQWRP